MKLNTITASLFAAVALAGSAIAGPMYAPAPSKEVIVPEPEPCITGEIAVGYDTMYNFRGVNFGDHAPWAGVDLSICTPLEAISLNVGVWYTNPVQPITTHDNDELDVYGFVVISTGTETVPVEIAIGGTWFYFAEADADATEAGVSVTVSPYEVVDINFTWYYDFTTDGHYFEGSVGKSFDLVEGLLGFGISAGASYGNDYYGVNSFNHAFVRADFPITLTETVSLNPYVAATWALEDLADAGEGDHIYGGVSLAVSF